VLAFPFYDIALFVLDATLISDLVLPLVLLGIAYILKATAEPPPSEFQSRVNRIAVAWVLSLTWRLGHIEPIRQQLQEFPSWQDFSLPPLLDQFLLINTLVLHFYAILALLALLCRFWWRPSIPFLRSRAYPILMVSIALSFVLGLYFRYTISPQNRDYFTPPWYFYYGAVLFVVVASIQRLQNMTPANTFLSALDPAMPAFFLTKLWNAFIAHATIPPASDSSPTPDSSPGNQLVLADPSRDLFAPSEGPAQTAYLRLRRSQRATAFAGKVLFALDARMEVPAEQRNLISKYRLGDVLVYDSADRQRYTESAKAHLESTRDNPSLLASPKDQLLGAGKTLYRLGRASVSAARAGLALRVTIGSLLAGVHVECKSLEELLEAESAIVSAAQNLKSYLETAATFDGSEEIIEL
jgi:hypothetical protein